MLEINQNVSECSADVIKYIPLLTKIHDNVAKIRSDCYNSYVLPFAKSAIYPYNMSIQSCITGILMDCYKNDYTRKYVVSRKFKSICLKKGKEGSYHLMPCYVREVNGMIVSRPCDNVEMVLKCFNLIYEGDLRQVEFIFKYEDEDELVRMLNLVVDLC